MAEALFQKESNTRQGRNLLEIEPMGTGQEHWKYRRENIQIQWRGEPGTHLINQSGTYIETAF